MKRLCLTTVLFLYAIMTIHAVSLSWTASAPAEGTYFLYNVGADSFIYGGHDWGTRASLTPKGGVPMTLVSSGTEKYYISTHPVYNSDMYFSSDGSNIYMDQGKTTTWKFIEVEGETNTYIMQSTRDGNSRYLVADSSDPTLTVLVTSKPTGVLGYWKLASRENLIADLQAHASGDNPLDATWLILDPFISCNSRATSVWQGSPGKGGSEDPRNECFEKYNTGSFDVCQVITGVPNGVYELQCQGFYRMGSRENAQSNRNNGTEALNAKYYINNAEGSLKSIFDYKYYASYNSTYNSNANYPINGVSHYIPNDMKRAANNFSAGEYWNEPIRAIVTDGKLQIGVKKSIAVSEDWAIFDNFVLTYCGTDLNAMAEQAIEMWHRKYDIIVNQATDHSAFDAVLANAAANLTTDEKLEEYNTLVWETVCDILKAGTTTTGLPFDITSLIDNASFDSGTGGWSANGSVRFSEYGLADLFDTPNGSITQTLPLMPAGTYTLKAQAFYRSANEYDAPLKYKRGTDAVKANLVFGNQRQLIWNLYDQARYQPAYIEDCYGGANQKMTPNSKHASHEAFNDGLYWNVLNTTTTADGDITLGLTIENGENSNWMVFDNFRLYYGDAAVAVDLTQGMPTEDTQATTVTTGITLNAGQYNKVCLPFDLDATKTAETFSNAYTLMGVQDGVGQLVPVTTIEAGKPYYVTVGSTKQLSVSDVLVRVAKPDSIPVLWEGAATVGTFDGFTFTINPSPLTPHPSSFAPVDWQNMSFTVNQENWRVRRFLNDFIYTESMSPKVEYYNAGTPMPLDQPHSVFIPVPQNSSALTITVSSDDTGTETFKFAAGTTLCEVPNLRPQNTYHYQVEAGGSILTQGEFQTEGHLRMIKANTGFNIRDMGGRLTLNGNRLRYGKVYRGGELNYNHQMNSADLAELRRLCIGADLDWRRNDECGNTAPTTSVLTNDSRHYLYLNHDYSNMDITYEVNKEHYKQAFAFILDNLRNNKAVYFHCRIGADRTGVYGLLLGGLCGLTYDQLCKDYELTTFSESGTRKKDSWDFDHNYTYIKSLPGNTLQQKFFYFLNTEVGIDEADLLELIDMMTDGESGIKNASLAFMENDGTFISNTSDIKAICALGSTIAAGATAKLSDGTTTTDVAMTVEGLFIHFADHVFSEANKEYTLTIPAGAVVKGGTGNAQAVTLRFKTSPIVDGVYYFRNTDASYKDKYIARGGSWSTQAQMEDYGLATYLAVDRTGKTTIQFFDNDMCLGDDGYCYTDCTGGRLRSFTIEKVPDGYKFKNTNNGKYLAIYSGKVVADAVEGDNLVGTTNVWALETTDEYASACYARNVKKQITTAASAAGLTGTFETGADLEAAFPVALDVNIPAVEPTAANNKYGANAETSEPYTYFEKTVTGLTKGLYKLSFKAMQRGSSYSRVDKAEGARGLIYAYAGTAKTQLVSAMEQGAATAYDNNYYSERTGLNYPNDNPSAFTAFDNGLYTNDIYVYVTGTTLKFGIKNPSRLAGDYDCYTAYGDFTLTQFLSELSELVSIYQTALSAAKTTYAKTSKMAESLRTALGTAIATYDEGKVSLTDQSALEDAVSALRKATNKANTSIASYAVIARGTISDSSLTGWNVTNNGDLKINTWSNESDNDGGSGFNQPFIENWIYIENGLLGAGKCYYRLEGLEPGEVINVKMRVRACNEMNNTVPNGPVVYINDKRVNFASIATLKDKGYTAILWAMVDISAAVGDDGVLEFGLETTDACNYNWHAIKSVKISYGDGTAIHSTEIEDSDIGREELYDLLGRRVVTPRKGLYITRFGKKILVK